MESQRIIHRFFLSLWLILLPFWDLGAGLALVLAFLAVVWRDRTAAKVKWLQSASFWPLWGIVAMVGIAGLWHESELETHLRVLPCMLLFWAFDRETIQKALPLGGLILMLYLLGSGAVRFLEGADFSTLLYRGLLEGLHQHVYIGSYLLIAVVAVWTGRLGWRIKGLYTALVLFFLGLLGAKMLILSTFLSVLWFVHRRGRLPAKAGWAGLLLVLGFVLTQAFSEGRALGHVLKPVDPYWATGSVDTRVVQAQAAWTLIQERPWTGWGTVEKQAALDSRYTEMNYRFGMKRHLNVHNQFLEWALSYGLVGIGVLLLSWIVAFRLAPWEPFSLGLVLIYFGSLWLTESMMERSLGVSLFALAWAWMVDQSKSQSSELDV